MTDKLVNIPKTTFSFEYLAEDAYGRPGIKRNGYIGEGTVLAEDEDTVVVRWKGWGENPGSKYSGLYNYYPSTTEVFVFDHEDKFGRRRYRSLLEWQTKPTKK